MVRYADYRESNLEVAMSDIRKAWPGFDKTYFDQVSSMMHRIYDGLANGKKVFVDKTPRYTLIAEDIYKCFPNAKFLVLWRHPLAIAASVSVIVHFKVYHLFAVQNVPLGDADFIDF